MKAIKIIAVLYVAIFIVTYGKVFLSVPDSYVTFNKEVRTPVEYKAFQAFFSSMLWPFYWSVQMWRDDESYTKR